MGEAIEENEQRSGATDYVDRVFANTAERWSDPPKPPFELHINQFKSFDALLSDEDSVIVSPADMIRESFDVGRVLLSGRGGAAKSAILRNLARKSAREHAVVFIDLKAWNAIKERGWDLADNAVSRINILLADSRSPRLSLRTLESVSSSKRRILFVDGLNEVPAQDGQLVIDTLDEFAAVAFAASVIISDRLVRRSLSDPTRWALFRVAPLSHDEIKSQLRNSGIDTVVDESDLDFLSTPLFLDAAIRNKAAKHSRTETFHDCYAVRLKLSEEQLQALSTAALGIYQNLHSRVFPIDSLRDSVGNDIVNRLQEFGVLEHHETGAFFSHHLDHDYLASRYVATNDEAWNSKTFDDLTFNSSSFDALALVMEQLPNDDRGDLFLRRLYDWNVYGAAYALSEGVVGDASRSRVSAEMQLALTTMLGIRRWDLFESTRERAMDALRLISIDPAGAVLRAASLNDVKNIVVTHVGDTDLFHQWKRIFLEDDVQKLDIERLLDDESLIGWTLSNKLKSLELTDANLADLRKFADSEQEPQKRWRAIHTLGAFPSEETVVTLLRALDEPGDDQAVVRYGAIRSLLENLALDREGRFRELIVSSIIARSEMLLQDRRTLSEFQRALWIAHDRAPNGWSVILERLLESFFDRDDDQQRREDWQLLGLRLHREFADV